jgi:hypothetical protein
MDKSKAWQIAEEAWRKTRGNQGSAKRKCEKCFDNWDKDGSRPEGKPPLFPPDFDGDCPDCGGKLADPTITF